MIRDVPGRYVIALAATLVVLLATPLAPVRGEMAAPVAAPSAPTIDPSDIPPVIPQMSIRGIQLGMGPERVLELIERRPDTSTTQAHPIVERTKTVTWGGLRVVYDGVKAGARVISISSTSKRDRTDPRRRRRIERGDGAPARRRRRVPHRVRLQALLDRQAARGQRGDRLLDLTQGPRLAHLAVPGSGLTRRSAACVVTRPRRRSCYHPRPHEHENPPHTPRLAGRLLHRRRRRMRG